MRSFIIFGVSLLAFIGSLTTIFATQSAKNYNLRGYRNPTTYKELPYKIPRFGVNADLTQYNDDETLRQHLDWMQEIDIHWIRQIVSWELVEPEQTQYQWQQWDRIVSILDEYDNLQLVPVFMDTPSWARPDVNNSSTTPPSDAQFFSTFVGEFSQRYGNQIDYYQIWDEPNLRETWGNLDPKATEYVNLLCEAYQAIHASDVGTTVITAALAPTTETGPRNISDILYLEQLYAVGAGDCFDAVAGKPYGFDHSPLDRRIEPEILNFSRFVALREIMENNGDGQKTLWASNWGWNHLPEDWQGSPSIWGNVTQEQQIQYTQQALQRAEEEWAWLGGMILHQWQPNLPDDNPQWGFALINSNNQPTALWQALSQSSLSSGATNGLFHPINPYTRYSGIWEFGPLGADIGWLETSDSQFEFDFTGTEVSLLLREGDYIAFLYPKIDGNQANTTPTDTAGNAYIFLRSDNLEPQINLIPVSKNLKNTDHTLQVIADKGWDQWAIVGYAVSSGNLAEPYNRQFNIAIFTTIITGLATIIAGRAINWTLLFKPLHLSIKSLSYSIQLGISIITSLALLAGMLLTWNTPHASIFRREAVHFAIGIVSAGIIYLQFSFILTLLAGIVLFVLLYHKIEIGLLLTIFWSPFFLFPVELYSFAFPMAEITILLTTGAWILRLLSQWGRERQSSNPQFPFNPIIHYFGKVDPIDYGVLAWIFMGFIAVMWSGNRSVAVTELRTLFVEPFLFYLILRTSRPTQADITRLIDTLVLSGFMVALIGLFMYVQGDGIIEAENGARRLAGIYGSPNNVGLYLGRCIPFALAYLLTSTALRRKQLVGIALIIMSIALALTQSVGAILIGVPVGVATTIIMVYGRRAWKYLAGLSLIGSTIMYVLFRTSPRFSNLLDFREGTNFFRLRVWESAINIIQDHPITGLGLDQFLYEFRGHYIRPDAIWDRDLSHPHNFILDFWTRLGILGVFIFVWIQFYFWKTIAQLYGSSTQNPLKRAIIIGSAGSMVDLLAHGLIDNSIYVLDLAYVWVLLLGILVVLKNSKAEGKWDTITIHKT